MSFKGSYQSTGIPLFLLSDQGTKGVVLYRRTWRGNKGKELGRWDAGGFMPALEKAEELAQEQLAANKDDYNEAKESAKAGKD